MGRSAGAVRAIRLKGDDTVVGGCAVAHEEVVVIATEQGFAKRTEVDEFPVQARGGAGVKAAKIDKTRGRLVGVVNAGEEVAFVTADSCLVVPGTGVRASGRDGGGSKTSPGPLQKVVAAAPPRDDS